MAGDGVKWVGMLKWSLSHADGTRAPRNISEEDRRWFMEAMQAQTVDVVKRMKEITLVMKTPKDVLEAQGVASAGIEDMLEELQELVESIDMANDLHSIGGLAPLLAYLKNSEAGIRAKAADVVSTIVQNNPKSQQLVMEANGLEFLMSNFASDPNTNARISALSALSLLIRHNKPGIAAFRLASGFAALRDAMVSENPRLQRKALNLIQYLLRENNSDCHVAAELVLPRLMAPLASSDDSSVREAALGGLLELVRDRASGSSLTVVDEEKLKKVLQDRINIIGSMSTDDLGAAQEERRLVDSIWSACYEEPSSLQGKGLLVLPGEDTPQTPPDVVGKLFEPPLRAWPAKQTIQLDSVSKPVQEAENAASLLLGPAPEGGEEAH